MSDDYLFNCQGKGHFMPYVKEAHSDQYGGPRDYYNCTNQSGIADRYYIITTKPTKKEIEDLSKGMSFIHVFQLH